mmetsp:Transcript_6597/g.5893  ORF Transcript_6597/g.5893 Transcript_6597/m.5893 type:complete len:106 (+) Transcript_6597:503-820(+)
MDLENGEAYLIDEQDGSSAKNSTLKGATSIPFMLQTERSNGVSLVQGSLLYSTTISQAIEKCLLEVDQPFEVVIDIILSDEGEFDVEDFNSRHPASFFLRYATIK